MGNDIKNKGSVVYHFNENFSKVLGVLLADYYFSSLRHPQSFHENLLLGFVSTIDELTQRYNPFF